MSIHRIEVFSTQRQFFDFRADDMQCGDLSEQQLRGLGLHDISTKVDPYRLRKYSITLPDIQNSDGFNAIPPNIESTPCTLEECSDILFDEMRELAKMFSFYGKYKEMINKCIDHFQHGDGRVLTSELLDRAYHLRVFSSMFESDPLYQIKYVINDYLKRNHSITNHYSLEQVLKTAVSNSRLPKFNNIIDNINGLGISVHDIHAQRITLLNFSYHQYSWNADILFEAEDHFGLDKEDISNFTFRNLRFFRIWFFLQRYNKFNFKPFMTRFSAIVKLNGL